MSYRSYASWKTNLPSYKSGSTYSSRDDITGGDGKTVPRFGSITSPAAYRPSYSGGTYRSVPIKREPPITTYVNRYSTNTVTDPPKEDKNKITETVKKIQKPSLSTTTTTTATTKYGTPNTLTVKEPTITNSTGNLSRYSRSRDPSPALENRTRLVTPSRMKSREPSPAQTALRGRSRDPSPSDVSLRSKIASPVNSYASSYRLCPRSSSGYSSRYGSNNSLGRSSVPTGALSYMSSSDMRARSVSRQQEQKEKEIAHKEKVKEEDNSDKRVTTTEEESEVEDESSDSNATVSVTVITRGTSPTPPGSTFNRTRRIDLAKTIEKTIQRPLKKHKCVDKEIQSDRLDDSTRYSRFSATSRVSSIPWSPYTESKLVNNMRYSSSGSSKSRDSSSKSELESNERKKDDTQSSISRNSSNRSSLKKEKPKTKIATSSSSASNSTSLEAFQNSSPKTLPPTIPKTESPSKSISSLSGGSKLPNKDFRKNAFNIGPSDRSRKSRTPSTSTDSEEKNEQPRNTSITNLMLNGERSPSIGSEISATSSNSSSAQANSGTKRCHQPKIRASSTGNSTLLSQIKSLSLNDDNSSVSPNCNESLISGGISECYNKSDRNIVCGIQNKHQPKYQQQLTSQQSNTNLNVQHHQHDGTGDSFAVSKNEGATKTYLVRKLGSVSNFFATRSQDTSGETIYLDKSNSNNSTSNDFKLNGTTIATITKTTASVSPQQYNPVTIITDTQTNNNITSTNNSKNTENTTDIDDSSWWLNTSQQIDTESALDVKDEMKFKLRHIDSGEIAWWMRNDEDDTIAEDIKTYAQDEPVSEYADNSQNTENVISPDNSWWANEQESKSEKYKVRRNDSGEQAWWMNESEPPWLSNNTSENNKQYQSENKSINNSNSNSNQINQNTQNNETFSGDSFWNRNSSPEKNKSPYRINRVDSNEKPWWMEETNDENTKDNKNEVSMNNGNSQYSSETNNYNSYYNNNNIINRVDSDEKPWWMEDTNNTNNIENQRENLNNDQNLNKLKTTSDDRPWWMAGASKQNFQIRHIDSGEKAWWLEDDPLDKTKEKHKNVEADSDYEIKNVAMKNQNNTREIYHQQEMLLLGDRASPEGLEDPTATAKGRKSPYDNCNNSSSLVLSSTQKNNNSSKLQNSKKLFISRHTNIDELLGGSCRPLSPILDRFNGKKIFLEEITPAQVRIHDSTAQMPIIQRMEREPSTFGERDQQTELDDAALQVYKDGDYGAYLDLESSLAEQAEEIEGLNSSRKNSLVVRTQLSVRVHAIIEKLLSSEGSELRRALFSLKQIFQEDKDLVHGFVALGGLNCLVRVGNVADQNYQNYILRALGQVMLYVDGMNGVMKHGPTIQWLYSLIASKYRLVVKTALKLLLVFVEYVESNCYLLVNAIHAVDNAQGTLPWSNIMKLLKDYENADTELLIYATSLINKTLSGLSDQDSFYDESDFLEQQGMEGVIQRYMSRPGTDLDLLDQLQLYEAVLKFEDGETDGIRLPDNSVRKTLRYRSSTDSAERRKSRRHSTGTSPQIQQQSPAKRYTPPTNQGILDEDSSSSNNSNEFNGGVFRDCNKSGKREGAGVTPGLRRRRERAERQKSFMKEQQEALANGIKSPFDKTKDELNGLGQIVTAIPVHLQNGNDDSPPDSLVLSSDSGKSSIYHQEMSDTSSTLSSSDRSSFSSSPLSNTTISVLSNNLDRKSTPTTTTTTTTTPITPTANNNNNNNSVMTNERAIPTIVKDKNENSTSIQSIQLTQHSPPSLSIQGKRNPSSGSSSVSASSEFISNKNLVMRTNNNATSAAVINGLKKNIHRNESKILIKTTSSVNNHNNNNTNNSISNSLDTKNDNKHNIINSNGSNSSYNNHKKFENESNRLNNFYNQISAVSNVNSNSVSIKNNNNNNNVVVSNSILNQKNNLSPSNKDTTVINGTTTVTNTPTKVQTGKQQQQQQTILSNGNLGYSNGRHLKNIGINNNNNSTNRLHQVNSPSGSSRINKSVDNNEKQQQQQQQKDPQLLGKTGSTNTNNVNSNASTIQLVNSNSNNGTRSSCQNSNDSISVSNNINGNSITNGNSVIPQDVLVESENENKKLLLQLKRDHTVKDLTQKLSHLPSSPQDDKSQNRIGDMTGLISKAKEGLAKSKSKGEISRSPSVDQEIKKSETKKSENEVHWEELVRNMCRPLTLCDLDFTDLNVEDEKDVLASRGLGGNIPPPPPPVPIGGMPPPPSISGMMMYPPPPLGGIHLPPPPTNLVPPPIFNYNNNTMQNSQTMKFNTNPESTIKKNKKTVKLFWKEVREDMIPPSIGKTIWDELPQAEVDIQKLEHLFESRAKDLMTKKQQEMNKNKEIIVLDHKRSNAINIAMTKLPPPRAIKAAILKMDATVVTREGIDKLLNMLPTDEERGKIQEAQMSNPELPLGSAEQFLLTLSSISELAARLKLWAFKLDFENNEREIAEPLMDLKQGIELLRNNKTFKCILSTLLSIGIFLNGAPVKGFQIEYLAKVPEVKDTVHKHSLLHHLCHMVMESSPDTTDLYSEIGPITRASKADFTELAHNLIQMETECKASWDRLKLIAKHDCPPQLKQKLVDFLADCAERIIILQIVHRRIINRYRKFLLWLGVPQHRVAESKPNEFCRILSEFALEYRTTRERVHQQMEKKANHRERNKTRGKMIIDIEKFRTQEDRADAELKQLLGSPNPGIQSPDGTLTWRRRRADNIRSPLIKHNDENFTDGDDEILESLVKTATKAPGTRTTPRERKRTRHADRKSLKRSRTREGFTVERVAASP